MISSVLKDKKFWCLVIVAIVFFFLGNNLLSLTDPDEVFYSLSAKEMLERHEWLTPYIFGYPQFEKPVLTYWLIMVGYKIWGITPWAARFFPALFATLAVVGVYWLGLLLYKDKQRAFWAGLMLATSAFFVGMGKTVFTDMIFATFILYALLSFYIGFLMPRFRAWATVFFYLFGALASLTKGPLGLFIPELAVLLFLMYRRRLDVLATPWVVVGFFVALSVALPWYAWMIKLYGNAFIHEFSYNDHWRRFIEAEHRSNDRWFFYPLSMIAGMFPFSIFVAIGFKDIFKRLKAEIVGEADHFLLAWLLVVFLIFQFAHSKLVSYILPLFPALALLTADVISRHISSKILLVKAVLVALLGVGVMFVPAVLSKHSVIPTEPVYWLSAALLTIAGLVYCCTVIGREQIAMYFLSTVVMVVLIGGWFAKPFIEDLASCQPVSQYLPAKLPQGQRMLTSKPYARGIAFYAGYDVAVMDPGGKGYFSAHPIPSFSDDTQLTMFLNSQPITYAYLKKSGFGHLMQHYQDRFKITPIKAFGTNQLVKIEPIIKS